MALPEFCLETPVQRFDVRKQKNGEALQMDAELIAQDIGCVRKLGRYFR